MLSNPEQLSVIEKAETMVPKLKKTSEKLTDLGDKLKAQLADINKKIADNNTPPISDKKIEKLIGLKTELGLLTLADKRAVQYLKQTTTNMTSLNTYVSQHKTDLINLIKRKKQDIQNSQSAFKKSSQNTEHTIKSLAGETAKIENKERKIITKKRQTVLSKDETRYNMVMFFTLIAINITILIYIFYLVHK